PLTAVMTARHWLHREGNMNKTILPGLLSAAVFAVSANLALGADSAPARAPGLALPALAADLLRYDTAEGMDIQVRVVARGLNHPWSMAWLPDGTALITEKNSGTIRRFVND